MKNPRSGFGAENACVCVRPVSVFLALSKTLALGLSSVVLLAALSGRSQGLPGLGEGRDYSVVERGPHHNRFEAMIWEPNPLGEPVPHVLSYVELASGLNFFDETTGRYEPSREEWTVFPDAIVARFGQTKVILGHNVNLGGCVDVLTAGTRLISNPIGIGIYDPVDGKHLLLAVVKDSAPAWGNAANEIIFPDCLDGLRGAIRFVYTRAGLAQHFVIEERFELPLGFSAKSRVEFYTEFHPDTPQPEIRQRVLRREDDPLLRAVMVEPDFTDATLDFGALKFIAGKAFVVEDADARRIPIGKSWQVLDGRPVLVEAVEFRDLEPLMAHLAAAERRADEALAVHDRRKLRQSTEQARLPGHELRPDADQKEIQIARASLTSNAVAADYVTVVSQTDMTFRADETYFVSASGPVYLDGTTRIEGNSVIKFAQSPSASIHLSDTLVCATAEYRPVVLTGRDDNTVGQAISGSTGNPSGYYGNIALDLSDATTVPVLSYLHFRYLSNALGGSEITLQNAQATRCKNVFENCPARPTLRNVLIDRVNSLVGGMAAGDEVTAVNVTVRYATNFMVDTTGTISLTNCLFVAVTNWQCLNTFTNSSVFLDSETGVFQTVGAAAHYLAADSPYRNAGTTNIPAGLLADLRKKTTYPPIVYSNVVISADTTFSPQAQRSTEPDMPIGYMYDALDYVFGGVTNNANITFTAGTAVGWFRTSSGWGMGGSSYAGHGITLADNKTVIFDGRADAPCYWVRYNTVQEQANGNWAGHFGPGGITGRAWPDFANAPVIQARFLRCSMTASEPGNHFRDDWGYLIVEAQDCEFYGGSVGGYISRLHFSNSLMERVSVWLHGGRPDGDLQLRNCAMNGGVFNINRWTDPNDPEVGYVLVSVRDSAFDDATFQTSDFLTSDPNYNDYDYNAYLDTNYHTNHVGANDVLVTNFNWQTGPLGNFYLPSDSDLIDAGSVTADERGLYHYTTQVDQTKEETSRVDISYHYVALNQNGEPIDTDGDGVPDYIEDANGNGEVDSGETDWRDANDLGLRVLITRPRSGGVIP